MKIVAFQLEFTVAKQSLKMQVRVGTKNYCVRTMQQSTHIIDENIRAQQTKFEKKINE